MRTKLPFNHCVKVKNELYELYDEGLGFLLRLGLFEIYLGAKSNRPYHHPRTDFRSYFLSFEDGARLEIMTKPGLSESALPRQRYGLIHLAFSLGSQAAVDGYYESTLVVIEDLQIELTI